MLKPSSPSTRASWGFEPKGWVGDMLDMRTNRQITFQRELQANRLQSLSNGSMVMVVLLIATAAVSIAGLQTLAA